MANTHPKEFPIYLSLDHFMKWSKETIAQIKDGASSPSYTGPGEDEAQATIWAKPLPVSEAMQGRRVHSRYRQLLASGYDARALDLSPRVVRVLNSAVLRAEGEFSIEDADGKRLADSIDWSTEEAQTLTVMALEDALLLDYVVSEILAASLLTKRKKGN